jgi:hypothetical protein
MLLLGRDWRAFSMPEHEVEVYWEAPFWRWHCSCGLSLGYGNVRHKIEIAAARHVERASA